MKQRRWSEDEEIYLDYFLHEPDQDFKAVAEFLGRSVKSVSTKADRMRKLEKNKRYLEKRHPYSEKEIEFLKRNYQTMKYKEIAIALRRSEISVQKKAWRLGLEKLHKPIEKKEEILRLNAKGLNSKEIGNIVNLPPKVIREFCTRQGVKNVPVKKEEYQKKFREMETARFAVR